MNPTTANLARIDAWVTTLAEEVDTVAHSTEMTHILEMMSRFWTYSARNCYLITLQAPLATRVASRKTWESLAGTSGVTSGARASRSCVPTSAKSAMRRPVMSARF